VASFIIADVRKFAMYNLRKRRILRRKSDFQRVYRSGRSFANRYLVLYVIKSQQRDGLTGFAAGKKLGNAVTRNRVKRLLRESYRKNQFFLKKGYNLLLVGRLAAVPEKCKTLEKAFRSLAKKAGLWEENSK
jgi:ribonuclease P protein component